MTIYFASKLNEFQTINFNPATDKFVIDLTLYSINDFDLFPSGAGTSAYVDLFLSGADLKALTTANITFTNGMRFIVGDNTIGTTADDSANVINGTGFGDYVMGLGGDDSLSGFDGYDRLYGGDGADRLNGGAGNDYLYGGDGVDAAIYVTSSRDAVIINNGADIRYDGYYRHEWTRSYTVMTPGEGVDLLQEIENVQFSDRTIVLANLGRIARPGIVATAYGPADGFGFFVPDVDPSTLPSPTTKLSASGYVSGSLQTVNVIGDFTWSYPEDAPPVVDGVIHEINAEQDGKLLISITGMNISVSTLRDLEFHFSDFELGGWIYSGDDTMNGSSANETFNGYAGEDKLNGGGGNDALYGGADNDTLDGGEGTDAAIYVGARADYLITKLPNGSYTIRDGVAGRDGVDTLTGVEKLSFSDGAWDLSSLNVVKPGRSDFNGDGHSDILLQNMTNGGCYLWQMNGLSLLSDVSSGNIGWRPGQQWQAKSGAWDFNADGSADVLLQNAKDGSCYVWQMDGLNLKTGGYGSIGWTPGADWAVKGGGDFNGDGKSDVLLQNANDGACYVWEMDGLSLKAGGHGSVGWTPGKDWQAKGSGDFNGDGKSDILLQNATDGACYVWEMDGLTLKAGGYGAVGWTPGKDWQAKGIGDFNGDGKSDILLQNATDGACYVWEMDGLTLKAGGYGSVGWTPGKDWTVAGVADFNGDGKSDILLQNVNSGACYVWELDGLKLVNSGAGQVGWTPGADWHAVA